MVPACRLSPEIVFFGIFYEMCNIGAARSREVLWRQDGGGGRILFLNMIKLCVCVFFLFCEKNELCAPRRRVLRVSIGGEFEFARVQTPNNTTTSIAAAADDAAATTS